MTFFTVPLTPNPSQTLNIVLGGQATFLYLQSRNGKIYIDVHVDKSPVIQGRLCLNNTPIVNEHYRGFVGDLFFIDNYGTNDPVFSEIGTRYFLIYWDGQND